MIRSECRVGRGDRVVVREEAIRPWTGTVAAVKWSSVSGWWAEVRRDDGGTYVIREADVYALEEAR